MKMNKEGELTNHNELVYTEEEKVLDNESIKKYVDPHLQTLREREKINKGKVAEQTQRIHETFKESTNDSTLGTLADANLEGKTIWSKSVDKKVEEEKTKKGWFGWVRNPFTKRNATIAVGVTAAMAGKAQGPNVQNSFEKNLNVQERKIVEKYTPFEQVTNKETVGNITMEGYVFVPQKDTTKEFITVYASENSSGEHSIGNLIILMKNKGYLPADRRLLENVAKDNSNDPRFKKLMPWVMALTPEVDANDSRMNEKRIVSTTEQVSLNKVVEKNKDFDVVQEIPTQVSEIYSSIPSHAVFPTVNPLGSGRYELDQGVPFDKYGFLFYKPVDKTTVNYSDLAKK